MPVAEPVIVIGGGLGGLSAAIHLRLAGRDVLLLEQGPRLGGKCNRLSWEGYHFDTGPSLLTMPFVVEGIFKAAGKRLEDYLELRRLDPACRYFFPDWSRFDAPGTLAGWDQAVADQFPGDFEGWKRFRRTNEKLWEVSFPVFLDAPLDGHTPTRVPYGKALGALGALFPRRMDSVLRSHFSDPRLRQIFQRYATYNGSDPARTPSTFNVIHHAEASFGSWHPVGGIYRLVEALERLCRESGVEIRTGVGVDRLEFSSGGKELRAVALADGDRLECDQAVINQDAVRALAGELFREHPRAEAWKNRFNRRETSVSGYVLLVALDRQVEALECHNIFFTQDYDREFREIFEEGRPLSAPTLYLHNPGKVDSSLAPAGKSAWFILVNAPPLDRCPEWPEDYDSQVLELLGSRLRSHGIPFEKEWVVWSESRGPRYFESEYNAWHGSLYGLSSNTLRDAFFRVRNRGPVAGVAFAGGSAHPGGGIPLVLQSGRFAAKTLA